MARSEELHPIRILVLDRGWVMVARCPEPDGFALWLPVTHSRTIRRWGTSEGLGELCSGPTNSTILDRQVSKINVPVRCILFIIEVEQNKWSSHLKS